MHLIMEYYSALKRNELLIHTATRMNVKRLLCVKEARLRRLHSESFHLYDVPIKAKVQGQKPDQCLPGAGTEGTGLFPGLIELFCLDFCASYLTVAVNQNSENCTQKMVNFSICKLYLFNNGKMWLLLRGTSSITDNLENTFSSNTCPPSLLPTPTFTHTLFPPSYKFSLTS